MGIIKISDALPAYQEYLDVSDRGGNRNGVVDSEKEARQAIARYCTKNWNACEDFAVYIEKYFPQLKIRREKEVARCVKALKSKNEEDRANGLMGLADLAETIDGSGAPLAAAIDPLVDLMADSEVEINFGVGAGEVLEIFILQSTSKELQQMVVSALFTAMRGTDVELKEATEDFLDGLITRDDERLSPELNAKINGFLSGEKDVEPNPTPVPTGAMFVQGSHPVYLVSQVTRTRTSYLHDWKESGETESFRALKIPRIATIVDEQTGEVYVRSEIKGMTEDHMLDIEMVAYVQGKEYFRARAKADPSSEGAIKEVVIGSFKTTYEVSKGEYVPRKAVTVNASTGKVVSESQVIGMLTGDVFPSTFRVEEKIYDNEGVLSYRAVLLRTGVTGLVNKIESQKAERSCSIANYHHFEWVTDKWPVGSGISSTVPIPDRAGSFAR